MDELRSAGRIQILPASIAHKIAAGEVIDRPQAVVRELLDNAIDSGASKIDVMIRDGGTQSIVVQDNGSGMSQADVQLSWHNHATSKIRTEGDLYNIKTLGFRGEALGSIAQVSRLTISSNDGTEGATLTVEGGSNLGMAPYAGSKGTRIEVNNLFYNLPGRKRFLKRSSTESLMVKQILVDKALAHPQIEFRFYKDDKLDMFLPRQAREDYQSRHAALYSEIPQTLRFSVSETSQDVNFTFVGTFPDMFRHDRKEIQIFVNNRRVQEYTLVQAIEQAYNSYLPGGRYPYGALFLSIKPELIDVNIHPAKKEIKIQNLREIHGFVYRRIERAIRDSQAPLIADSQRNVYQIAADQTQQQIDLGLRPVQFYDLQKQLNVPIAYEKKFDYTIQPKELPSLANGVRYFGVLFGLMLLFEQAESFFLLDMHACHERILFEKYRSDGRRQKLLIPIVLDLEHEETDQVISIRDKLESIGFTTEKLDNSLVFSTVPVTMNLSSQEVSAIIRETLSDFESLERELYAQMACRAAIKDGDRIDQDFALEMFEKTMLLAEHRCPHGRPLYLRYSRGSLWQAIGREV